MRTSAFFLSLLFVVPVSAQWRNTTDSDPISGENTAYAISNGYTSMERMSAPYTGTTMSIGYGCSENSEWAYFVFSTAPNIANDKTESGYSTSVSRIRWDDTASTISLRQDWGERYMHFRNKSDIAKIRAYNVLVVELDWHGSGDVYFRVPLSGSTKATDRARDLCGIKPYLARAAEANRHAADANRQAAEANRQVAEIKDLEKQITRTIQEAGNVDLQIKFSTNRTLASKSDSLKELRARFRVSAFDSLKRAREYQITLLRAQIDSLSALLKTKKVIRSRSEYARIINERREVGLHIAHTFPFPTPRIVDVVVKRLEDRDEVRLERAREYISDSLYAAWGDSTKASFVQKVEVLQVRRDSLQTRLDQMPDVSAK